MAQQYYNPFANINLIVPREQHDFYHLYCQTAGRVSIDRYNQNPFPRMVDFWFAGLSLAARKQLKPINLANHNTVVIIEGAIFDRDSWRIQVVMLVAIAVEDDVEVVGDPSRMMAIANGLAAAGVPHIVEMLQRDRHLDPILNLSNSLYEILGDNEEQLR